MVTAPSCGLAIEPASRKLLIHDRIDLPAGGRTIGRFA
jgi:hypothetical protein